MVIPRRGSSLVEMMVVLFLSAAVLASLGATVHSHLAIAAAQREQTDFGLRLLRLAEQFRSDVRAAARIQAQPENAARPARLVLEGPQAASVAYEWNAQPARLTIAGSGPETARAVIALPKGSQAWFELARVEDRLGVTLVLQCPRSRKGVDALVETRMLAFLGAGRRCDLPKEP